jgi:hypothetical protein
VHTKERQSRGFNPRLDHLFDRYSMKHMVNNRMFSYPLSLNAIGAAAGLSAPISMLALRGKTIYDSAGTATVIPTTGTVSLSVFLNKTFPVNPIIFKSIMAGSLIISDASKRLSCTSNTATAMYAVLGSGNNNPFYLNISVTRFPTLVGNSASYYLGIYDVNRYFIGTRSHYFANGLTEDITLAFYYIVTVEATITSNALYTEVINYSYIAI